MSGAAPASLRSSPRYLPWLRRDASHSSAPDATRWSTRPDCRASPRRAASGNGSPRVEGSARRIPEGGGRRGTGTSVCAGASPMAGAVAPASALLQISPSFALLHSSSRRGHRYLYWNPAPPGKFARPIRRFAEGGDRHGSHAGKVDRVHRGACRTDRVGSGFSRDGSPAVWHFRRFHRRL